MAELKICTKCEIQKPVNAFALCKTVKSGYASRCRKCEQARGRQRYADNKELLKKQSNDYRAANHERRLEIERASRAKNKETYRLTKNARQSIRNRLIQGSEYLILPKELEHLNKLPCFACGDSSKATIDHVIPLARGGNHSIGNLLTLCLSCNASKGKRTMTEWKKSKNLLGVG